MSSKEIMMVVANNEVQVTWPTAANYISVPYTDNDTSEVFAMSATAFAAEITLKADNDGTPADGDTIDIYALLTCGDPDGASTSEYPNDDTDGLFLARLDTFSNDPAIVTVPLPVAVGGMLYAKNNSTGRAITVSACINEKTG